MFRNSEDTTIWQGLGQALGWTTPEHFRSVERELGKGKLHAQFENELIGAIHKNKKRIFVLAEWGAGKTFQSLLFRQEYADRYAFEYFSFFGIQNLSSAYVHAMGFIARLVTLCAGVLCLALVLSRFADDLRTVKASPLVSLTATLFVGFFVYGNRWRLAYVLVSISKLWIAVRGSRRVVILDDLDRSSLSDSDRWAFLSDLWTVNTQYIILLGYLNPDDRIQIADIAKKLDGAIIFLGSSRREKFAVVQHLWPDSPFQWSETGTVYHWLDHFTPRDFIAAADYVNRVTGGRLGEASKKLVGAAFIHHELQMKIGIPRDQLQYASLKTENTHLARDTDARMLGPKHEMASQTLASFAGTLLPEVAKTACDLRIHMSQQIEPFRSWNSSFLVPSLISFEQALKQKSSPS